MVTTDSSSRTKLASKDVVFDGINIGDIWGSLKLECGVSSERRRVNDSVNLLQDGNHGIKILRVSEVIADWKWSVSWILAEESEGSSTLGSNQIAEEKDAGSLDQLEQMN